VNEKEYVAFIILL